MRITNKDEVPEILYHYCSIDTFMKIIENKTIRLSNIFKMNDYSEVMHVLDFLPSALHEEYKTRPFSFNYKGIDNDKALDQIVLDIKKSINEVKFVSYIASFSASEDDLEQWNRYGDDGKGVAIGYNGKILYEIAEQCSLIITEVNYSVEDHRKFIKNVIVPQIFKAIKNAGDNANVKNDICSYNCMVLRCILSDISAILLSAVQYKHDAYTNEKEWRLYLDSQITQLHYPEDVKKYSENKQYDDMVMKKISFTNKVNTGISSYFDLSFKKFKNASNIIKKIIIGPRSIINKSDLDLEILLHINEFNIGRPHIALSEIQQSKIPYIG
ncbi:MAG: DUF2971 domain-containing protein [Syntrophales bacterium]